MNHFLDLPTEYNFAILSRDSFIITPDDRHHALR